MYIYLNQTERLEWPHHKSHQKRAINAHEFTLPFSLKKCCSQNFKPSYSSAHFGHKTERSYATQVYGKIDRKL